MKPFVIKCGGSVFEALPESFYQEIVDLQKRGICFPVLVHGGGPLITRLLDQLNISTTFHMGLRITTKETLEIVEMVLNGLINKKIVTRLIQSGGQSIGMSGIDGGLIKAEPLDDDKKLGWVGKVTEVNGDLIKKLSILGVIPVISPIGMDSEGAHYNINADTVAAAIAESLQASLCFITDVPGISIGQSVLKYVTKKDIQYMISDQLIIGGMVPKVQAAIDSLDHQVPDVVILNGNEQNVLTQYLNGVQVGTKIILGEEAAANV